MERSALTFSRTPRGFEANPVLMEVSYYQLSAEPLVGLKQDIIARETTTDRAFSRTPRGFEARAHRRGHARRGPFSRTPRGFEAHLDISVTYHKVLSAEPLVGLKPASRQQRRG